jgi:hypothetical protein
MSSGVAIWHDVLDRLDNLLRGHIGRVELADSHAE